jgi:uncharacterized protein (TIGR00297 family)
MTWQGGRRTRISTLFAIALAVRDGLFATRLSHDLLPAAALTVGLAWLAYRLGEVSASGAMAGVSVSLVLYAAAGLGGFFVLGVVFVITAVSSRFGRERKRALGIAESRRGRNAWQILANLVAGSVLSLAASLYGHPWLFVCALAALAEAAADTASSEVGKGIPGNVYLITSLRRVAAGVDGGVSAAGTTAGIVAAAAIALSAAAWGLIGLRETGVVTLAAVIGAVADSVLGATLQRAGWLTNSAVNLAGTICAATVALTLVR